MLDSPFRLRELNSTGANIGIGSTTIEFGSDLNTLKTAPGDTIRSLNGTYSGTIVSYATTGGVAQIIMDTAATVAFANTSIPSDVWY